MEQPDQDLTTCIVIPCYDEEHTILKTLAALAACAECERSEIIIVINDRKDSPSEVKAGNERTEKLIDSNKEIYPHLKIHIIRLKELDHKNAGVGMSRKVGMDEAAQRLYQLNRKNGIILCLDADSLVDSNYLLAVHQHFEKNEKSPAADIYYEHPIKGDDFDETIYKSIIAYELHLRYYINAKKWIGLPYAYQTVGSSMAVRAEAYVKEGGMAVRRAGEDFYFLHKFTLDKNFSSIKKTTVRPSPRKSIRVPFGTGKAVIEISENQGMLTTYSPDSFRVLKDFLAQLPELYNSADLKSFNFHEGLLLFLEENDWEAKKRELVENTKDYKSFCKRFYAWFNAFMCMKYLHFMRDHYFPNTAVQTASHFLLEECLNLSIESEDSLTCLEAFRRLDKQ